MKNEKKQYCAPEISVVLLNAGDLLATSGDHDANDNWADDIFGA